MDENSRDRHWCLGVRYVHRGVRFRLGGARDTARLAEAASTQANTTIDAEHRQLRAYVGPIFASFRLSTNPSCGPSDVINIASKTDSAMMLCYHFKNFGLTPARSASACGDRDNATVIFSFNANLLNRINGVIIQC